MGEVLQMTVLQFGENHPNHYVLAIFDISFTNIVKKRQYKKIIAYAP